MTHDLVVLSLNVEAGQFCVHNVPDKYHPFAISQTQSLSTKTSLFATLHWVQSVADGPLQVLQLGSQSNYSINMSLIPHEFVVVLAEICRLTVVVLWGNQKSITVMWSW